MRARRRRVVPRLILHRRLRRWRLKQRARLSEIGLACAVGEETVMSNAVKAIGKNVQQKATNKLLNAERHAAIPIPPLASIILPFKAHAPPVERDEPTVGDRDTMSVAREIRQDLLRSSEATLGVNNPISATAWL